MALSAGFRIGSYEIVALLGTGGMGEVYQARDTRLDRMVALKTMPAEVAGDADRKRRFLDEAQAASRLNHPNIVTIYGIVEENGVCVIAMEYVSGCTIEQLNTGSGLPLQDALRYGAEVADALAAAHSAGIIHRDVKPANIMIAADGRSKLLDFGLAKLAEPAALVSGAVTVSGTVPGAIMGTAAYMSPEQIQGRKLDARSDIFSFGLVLYEMLCGRRAFRGETWVSMVAAILHEEPLSLREINPAIPASLERHVVRCLRKDATQRFQTMAEVKLALAEAPSAVTAADELPSIAVLPFLNLSADKENEYFSDGLSEEIINALAKTPELRVIARTSAFAFRGKEHDMRSIGEKLRVGTILEGSVRRAGNRVRVTAQLIKVADESSLWSERYDREMTDIFAIQDDISQAIASALKVKLAAPRRLSYNFEAYQCYLKGLYWYQRYTPESLARSTAAFEQALVHDPGYALAYAGLAVIYYGLGALSIHRMTEMAPLAKSAAEKALAIDPALSEAHAVLGLVAGSLDFDWKTAERHFQTAMAAQPVNPLVRVRYALYFLIPLQRIAEAVEQFRRALETDPMSMMVHFGMSFAVYSGRQYVSAIEHAMRSLELYPGFWLVHFALGLAQSQQGLLQQGIGSLEETVRLSPSFSPAIGFLAAAYARAGNSKRAEELMGEVRERSAKDFVSPFCFAIYHAALGQVEQMFEHLEAALAERDPYLTRMDAEPYFEPYREDPRYRDLLRRMNLA